MANANAVAGAHRLKLAMRTLQERWALVDPSWDDAVRRRFEDRYLAPIDPAGDAALSGIQKLAEVLDRVRRDLSDRDALL
jgi:hypothetical protein